MHYRNRLGYFMLPAMMAVVTIAACAPRQPPDDPVPPLPQRRRPSAIRPPLGTRTQPRLKSSQWVKCSTKAKGFVLSVTGSAAKATVLLRIGTRSIRHAISRTAPFRTSGKMGNYFG